MTAASQDDTTALISRFIRDDKVVVAKCGKPRPGSSNNIAYVAISRAHLGGISGSFFTASRAQARGSWGTSYTVAEAVYYLAINVELPPLSNWKVLKGNPDYDMYSNFRAAKLAELQKCIDAK